MNRLEQYIGDLNPSCWLNADYVNGYGVTNPSLGSSISTWIDISGNGNNFVHEVIATFNPPILATTTLYGKLQNSVSFALANKNTLWATTSNSIWTTAHTTMIISSETTGGFVLSQGFTGAISGNLSVAPNGDVASYNSLGVELRLTSKFRTLNNVVLIKRTNNLFSANPPYSANTLFSSNGVSPTGNAFSTTAVNGWLNLGSRRLGPSGYDTFLTGKICEVVTFNRILNISETNQALSYIKQKYNI